MNKIRPHIHMFFKNKSTYFALYLHKFIFTTDKEL
jgi:hypothetical protein